MKKDKKLIKRKEWHCKRCGWDWYSKKTTDGKPVRCAGCKSPYWDVDPKTKATKEDVPF